MVNKKIASEFAIGIIIILAVAISGLFWDWSQKNQEVVPNSDIIKNEQVAKSNNAGTSNDATKKVALGQNSNGWWMHQDGEFGIKFNYPTKLEIEEVGWDSSGKIYSWKVGENTITTQKIEYDNDYAEQATLYEPYQFSSEFAKKMLANPSCDELSKMVENFSYDDKYKTLLPSPFKKPSICGYAQEGGIVKFYVIGLKNDTEGTPYMGSDIVVLSEKYAILMTDVLDLGKDVPRATQYKKTHPNIEFGSKEFLALREIYVDDITKQVNKPSNDLQQRFKILAEIAKSITLSK